MRIRILKQTRLDDAPLLVGAVLEVEEKTAARWLRNGIAEAAEAGGETEKAESGKQDHASRADDKTGGGKQEKAAAGKTGSKPGRSVGRRLSRAAKAMDVRRNEE